MPGSFAPIPEVQIGPIAYYFGITNDGTPISMQGLPSFELDSEELTQEITEKENMDTTGNVQNITQTNFRKSRSMKFAPSGATRAAAAAVCDAAMALQVLVVDHYKVASFNGRWRVKPGTKLNLKSGDNASIDFNLEKYDNAAQNSALTGTPIAG